MKRRISSILLLFVTCVISNAQSHFITSYYGEDWSLIFPASNLVPGSVMYRDYRWAIDLIELKCDGRVVEPVVVSSVERPQLFIDKVPQGTVIYSFRVLDFIVCKEMTKHKEVCKLAQYRVPADTVTVELKYKIRRPDAEDDGAIMYMTARALRRFPSGVEWQN